MSEKLSNIDKMQLDRLINDINISASTLLDLSGRRNKIIVMGLTLPESENVRKLVKDHFNIRMVRVKFTKFGDLELRRSSKD